MREQLPVEIPTKEEFEILEQKLNLKHRKFAIAYIANNGNATQAAISVGYSKKSANKIAYKLKINEDIQRYISYLRRKNHDKALKNLEITEEKKRRLLWEAANRALEADPTFATTVSAIKELNIMEGHHAPARTENVNLNLDLLNEVREMVNEYIREF